MNFDLFKYAPSWYKLIITVFIVLTSLLITNIIALAIAAIFFNIDIKTITNYLTSGINEENINLLKFLQFFQSIGTFLIPSFVLAFLFSGESVSYLRLNKKPLPVTLILIILAAIIAIPLINYTGYLNSKLNLPDYLDGFEKKMIELENEAARLTESLLAGLTISDLIVNLVIIAVLPALSEELLFRGIIQRLFLDMTKNIHLAIIICAAIFSFFHLQFYGFLPRFLLGIYFGYLFFWTQTIWIPIAAHFINNATAVIFYHFSSKPVSQTAIDEIGKGSDDVIFLAFSLLLLTFLLGSVYYYEKINTKNPGIKEF